jgi:uncharacterized protein YydD (DUF2326 family)
VKPINLVTVVTVMERMTLVQGMEKHGVLELALLLKDAIPDHRQQGRLHLKIIWLMELL